jgi:hypothetical protein
VTYGLRGELQYGLDQLLTVATDVLTDAPPPAALRESARSAAPRPVLLITAGTVPDETQAAIPVVWPPIPPAGSNG